MTVIQFPESDTRELNARVAEEVRVLMARHQVTQWDLAVLLDMTQASVSARLRGKTEWKVRDLQIVADAFGVHPSELLGGRAENPHPGPGGGFRGVRHQGLEPRTRWFDENRRPGRLIDLRPAA